MATRCYYHNDKDVGEVLISECWGTVHSQDISDCYCPKKQRRTKVQILEDEIFELKKIIDEITKRNKRLTAQLKEKHGRL